MAKTTPTAPEAASPAAAPRLGDSVMVQLAPGITHLRNNESDSLFDPGVPTPQTVTPTLLRRLADGDLVLVA